MKKIKYLGVIAPVGIVCSMIPLMTTTTTSCAKKDLKIEEPAEKRSYGFYKDLLGYEAEAGYYGFKLDSKLDISKLKVKVDKIAGATATAEATITANQNNDFDVIVTFTSEESLGSKSATFDLVFTYEGAQTTISNFSVVQFSASTLVVLSDCHLQQTTYTLTPVGDTLTYTIPEKFYYYFGLEPIDVSENLYVEIENIGTPTMEIVPSIVKDSEKGTFSVKFTVANCQDGSDEFYINVKHKQLTEPLFSRYCYFKINQGATKCFEFKLDESKHTAEIIKNFCNDPKINIPSEVVINSETYSITQLGWHIFEDNHNIEEVILPDSLVEIGGYAFYNCKNLKKIFFPAKLTTFYETTFSGCELDDIKVDPNNQKYTSIIKGAEQHCLLERKDNNFILALFSKQMGNAIPDGVVEIGRRAFYESNITEINIPDTVETIGELSFAFCPKLTSVKFSPNSKLKKMCDACFEYCGSLDAFEIPKTVETIESQCLIHTKIASLHIPASLVNLKDKNDSLKYIASLKNITVDPNNPKFTSQGTGNGVANTECNCLMTKDTTNRKILCGSSNTLFASEVATIGQDSFACNETLKDLIIPESITKIEDAAFNGTSLVDVTVKAKIDTLPSAVFRWCKKLKKLDLSQCTNLTTIPASDTFDASKNLETVLFPNTLKTLNSPINSPKLITVDFGENNTVLESIPDRMFEDCENLQTITHWPANIKTIGQYAFYNCISLTESYLSDKVTTIGKNAYDSCRSLSSLIIPSSVKTLPEEFALNCTGLTKVVLNNVETIGKSAFEGCMFLPQIDLSKVKSIGNSAFKQCGFSNITLSNDITSLGESAFEDCENLTSVELGTGLTKIPQACFNNCSKLTTITIPSNIVYIDKYAFLSSGLTEATFVNNDKWYRDSLLSQQVDVSTPEAAAAVLLEGNAIEYIPQ